MARHAVKNLRIDKRIPKSAKYWAVVAYEFVPLIPLRKAIGIFYRKPTEKTCGQLMSMLLVLAQQNNLVLSFESMDNYIRREGKSKVYYALGILSLSYSQWMLKVELGSEVTEEEKRVWLQNMMNSAGLWAAIRGMDPVLHCLEPVLRSAQK